MTGKQEYILLQCRSCSTYQVHIDKQSRRFACTLCRFKQPFSRVFSRSTKASDCRKLCLAYNRERASCSLNCSWENTRKRESLPDDDTQGIRRIPEASQTLSNAHKDSYFQHNVKEAATFSGWDVFLDEDTDHDEAEFPLEGGLGIMRVTNTSPPSRWNLDHNQGSYNASDVICTQRVKRIRDDHESRTKVVVDGAGASPSHSGQGWHTTATTSSPPQKKGHVSTNGGHHGQGDVTSAWFTEFIDE